MANAIILPHVLTFSRKDAQKKLARLAVVVRIGKESDSDEVLSRRLVDRIKEINQYFGIPSSIKEIREEDIPLIVKRAMAESSMAYAPPTLMSSKDCEAQVRRSMP